MEKYCDNRSVGVVLKNHKGELALLQRGRFPIGIAPAVGHIDEHGSPEQAAINEVSEELGVQLSINGLVRTVINERSVNNNCRRIAGDHHLWTVYEAIVGDSELAPDPDETKGAAWYGRVAIQSLADRTKAYQRGEITENQWTAVPGLEPVWLSFLQELEYVS